MAQLIKMQDLFLQTSQSHVTGPNLLLLTIDLWPAATVFPSWAFSLKPHILKHVEVPLKFMKFLEWVCTNCTNGPFCFAGKLLISQSCLKCLLCSWHLIYQHSPDVKKALLHAADRRVQTRTPGSEDRDKIVVFLFWQTLSNPKVKVIDINISTNQ